MNKIITIFQFFLLILVLSCSNNKQEKYQSSRKNIVNVTNKIVSFETTPVLIGNYPLLYNTSKYLLISDYQSLVEQIHVFNKLDLLYIKSTALRGLGPDEITRIGHVAYDKSKNSFYVSDHGKNKIMSYNIDSIIALNDYRHHVKAKMENKEFPSTYFFVNDSLSYAQIIQPTGNYGYNEILAKWSYVTDKITPLYQHPKIEKRRVVFTVSLENKLYVECYLYHDLLTICDLDGNLIHNVYGPNWDHKKSNKTIHFSKVIVAKNRIIAAYSGGENFNDDEKTDKLLVFDIKGDYIKTLEIGYRIVDMCFDEENSRIFFSFNDMVQFGYLEITDNLLN